MQETDDGVAQLVRIDRVALLGDKLIAAALGNSWVKSGWSR